MPNNVATKEEVMRNSTYRIILWWSAWLKSLKILTIPFIIFAMWGMVNKLFPLFEELLRDLLIIDIIIGISIDLVKLAVFSTLMILFIKLSIMLRVEITTLWDISTPRYREYAIPDFEKEYNKKSIFTKGYLPDSEIYPKEFDIMESYTISYFGLSFITYIFIQGILWLVGEDTLIDPIETLLTISAASDLILAIIGIPIFFANLVGSLKLSIYPEPITGIFFIEFGIPSVFFILGLRNGVSYQLYLTANKTLKKGDTYLIELAKNFMAQAIYMGILTAWITAPAWFPSNLIETSEIIPLVIIISVLHLLILLILHRLHQRIF